MHMHQIENRWILRALLNGIYTQIKTKHIPRHGMNFVVSFLRLTDTVHLDIAKLVSPFLFRSQNHTSKHTKKDQETELKTDTVSIGIADCRV